MEKNSIAAMVLIFLLWMGYLTFMAPKPEPPAPAPEAQPPAAETADRLAPADSPDSESAGAEEDLLGRTGEQQSLERRETAGEAPVDTIKVSSPLYEYHFITRGGVMSRAWLKQYPAFDPGEEEKTGEPVQLVPVQGSDYLHTRLRLGGADRPVDLGERHFTADKRRLSLTGGRSGEIEFVHTLKGGREVRIVYRFSSDSYLVEAEMVLPDELYGTRGNALEVTLGPTIVSNEKDPDNDYNDYGIVYYDDGEVVRKNLGDLDESDWSPSGEIQALWGGVKSKYFISAFFVPDHPMSGVHGMGEEEDHRLSFTGRFPVPEDPAPVRYSLYIGPQSNDQMEKLNYGMPKLLEYGWPIIKPFTKISLEVMLWLHQFIDNYVLILLIFAVIVKVIFYPLTIKSTKSQIKMQKIQPLMNQIKEQYKDDQQKLQQEMMRIYKEEKVNPLGGCLPLLIQMPVLIALFYLFQRTIEFRGAAGFGWIHDLSQPDPFYIIPVLMGGTTFLQQKMTPTQMDPKMKPMMYMMPAFMTFIFLNFSAGLVLYYTFINIMQILQQLYINRKYHGEPVKAAPIKKGGGEKPDGSAGAVAKAGSKKSSGGGSGRKSRGGGSRKKRGK